MGSGVELPMEIKGLMGPLLNDPILFLAIDLLWFRDLSSLGSRDV